VNAFLGNISGGPGSNDLPVLEILYKFSMMRSTMEDLKGKDYSKMIRFLIEGEADEIYGALEKLINSLLYQAKIYANQAAASAARADIATRNADMAATLAAQRAGYAGESEIQSKINLVKEKKRKRHL
jgi:hypothetical protein